MKVIFSEHGNDIVGIELTRRNLETLLLKLDREDSARTIAKLAINPHRTRAHDVYVTAVENEAHYEAEGRPAGEMHPAEEMRITRPTTGVALA